MAGQRAAAKSERTRRSFGRMRQLPSGRWQASYLHNGAVYKALATFPTKSSAGHWLQAEEDLIDLDRRRPGEWTPPAERAARRQAEKLTLRTYANTWLDNKTKLARRTRDNYRGHLDNHILPVLGDLGLAEITPEHVRTWFAGLGTEHDTRNAQAYAILNGVFNTAVADDLIERNPCRIKGAAQVKHAKRSVVLLDAAQLTELAAAMPDDARLAVLLAGWCALRKGEVFALRRCDIAADGSTVRIERAVTYREGKFEVGPTKTRESRRVVSVPPHVRPAVVDHLARHVGEGDEALVFTEPSTGSFAGEKRFRTAWEAAREAIGQPQLHFHDLRHAGGVMAAQAGATLREVMDRLGHTSPNMAMRYQHTAEGRAAALADKLSALAATNP
ncbi:MULTISPECIES: tyrosine-type recombinase/integrase [Mycolicibacterium]|uniref:Prophage phiRv2 integrase n=2 Tax=Mycolicibacterium TaxID=1866885 RepID=A0AAD1MX12_MYCMB|nr:MULTISPECIES: site-specific integrase [Mycolicibacterium]MDA4102850.1 integrase [Mycolicibacterium monacense DSM 44395]ORB14556.1 site-specific integrase [Mycolicibacterium monacense DSM 44395]ORB65708.1 site-specific integrase [Mycolicibacterium tusciae]QHP87474.1 site-specific integrase [Mycolicibacterium monacense DSM 44395]BBZ59394.1 putative prophage phiRv2 integrase [Mycolicibacterium monacense]